MSHRKRLRQAAVQANRLNKTDAVEGASAIGSEEHLLPVRRPSQNRACHAKIGETLQRAALAIHHIDLIVPLLTTGKGQFLAVWREAGKAHCGEVRRQPLCRSTLGGDAPQIVFRYKHHAMVVYGGETIVAMLFHRHPYSAAL